MRTKKEEQLVEENKRLRKALENVVKWCNEAIEEEFDICPHDLREDTEQALNHDNQNSKEGGE